MEFSHVFIKTQMNKGIHKKRPYKIFQNDMVSQFLEENLEAFLRVSHFLEENKKLFFWKKRVSQILEEKYASQILE